MKQLEKDKKSVRLSSKDHLYVEGFATRVFMKADKQERRGKANLKTAKTFYAASLFFEILHNFGDVSFDIEQKQKYAAWKAAEIRKALKIGSQPSVGLSASDEASSISDGGFSGSELPSEEIAANSPEPKSPVEQSAAVGSISDAVQEQRPFTTSQSCDNQNDSTLIFDTADGPNMPTTIDYNQQDHASDDDDRFHDCSEEADHSEILSSDSDSELDSTCSTRVVQEHDSRSDPRLICDTAGGPTMSTSNSNHHDAIDDDQFFHDCSQSVDDSELSPRNFCTELDDTLRATATEGEFPFSTNLTLSFDTTAGLIMSTRSDCDQQDAIDDDEFFHAIDDDQFFHGCSYSDSGLDCTINTPMDVQGLRHHPSSYSDSGMHCTINTPMDVQGLGYHPSAAEVVKAQKASRFAVSALASADVPSAISYLQQAIHALTNHRPQNQL